MGRGQNKGRLLLPKDFQVLSEWKERVQPVGGQSGRTPRICCVQHMLLRKSVHGQSPIITAWAILLAAPVFVQLNPEKCSRHILLGYHNFFPRSENEQNWQSESDMVKACLYCSFRQVQCFTGVCVWKMQTAWLSVWIMTQSNLKCLPWQS